MRVKSKDLFMASGSVNSGVSSFSMAFFSMSLSAVLFLITLFSGLVLSSSFSFAEDSVISNIDVSVPISCNMTGELDTPHTATVNAGTYQADIGTTTLKVLCNDSEGFSIYAIGFSNSEYGNTNLIGANDGQLVVTGTATSGNTSNWAMKLIKVTNPASGDPVTFSPENLTIENNFDDYNDVPTTYTQVASFTSSTDAVLGSKLQTTYSAYMKGTQLADTYNGRVKYTLVHPYDAYPPLQPQVADSGKIAFFPNAGGVVDTMGERDVSDTATSSILWASNFKRPGYGFAGWSDAFDYVANVGSESNPNAHIYGPNERIEYPAGTYTGTNPGLSLYAVWVKSAGNMQGWTGCSSLSMGNVTALTDIRDNNTYAVAKLADGKCWMIENLRLDTVNSLDATKSSTGAYGGVFSGLANPEYNTFGTTDSNSRYISDGSGSIYNPSTNPVTLTDVGTSDAPANRIPRYRNDNTNTDSSINPNVNVDYMTSNNQNVYGYGNYYGWASVVADTTAYTQTNTSISTSLCPTSWKVPSGGNKDNEANNDFWNLIVNNLNNGVKPANYSSQTMPYYYESTEAGPVERMLKSYPNNFISSGQVISSNVIEYRASSGRYWTSTSHSITSAFFLDFSGSWVVPGTLSDGKVLGAPIRCVIGS